MDTHSNNMSVHEASQPDSGVVVACHECDLVVSIPAINEGFKADCPRCGYVLSSHHQDSLNRLLAFSLSGLCFLFVSLLFPFLSFKSQGQERIISLTESFFVLVDQQYLALAIIIFITIILIPAFFLLSVVYVLSAIKCDFLASGSIPILRVISIVLPWNMVEIFLVGLLVSMIKISSMADVGFGISFWAYVLFSVCTTLTVLHIDKQELWHWVDHHAH